MCDVRSPHCYQFYKYPRTYLIETRDGLFLSVLFSLDSSRASFYAMHRQQARERYSIDIIDLAR